MSTYTEVTNFQKSPFFGPPCIFFIYTVVQKLLFHFTVVSVNDDQFLWYLALIILSPQPPCWGYGTLPKPHPLGTPALCISLASIVSPQCLLAVDSTDVLA